MCESWENRWAVVGFPHDQAFGIMQDIERDAGKHVFRRENTKNSLRTLFEDGTILEWIPATTTCRGYKFGRMWCNSKLDETTLKAVVYPLYFGSQDDIVWL